MATSLAQIVQDPNYVNANEATKRAIFDKYAPLDPNYAKANAATQEAIRVKFGVTQAPAASLSSQIPDQKPYTVSPEPEKIPFGRRVIEMVRPSVEAVGGAVGALAGGAGGTFGAGPVGTVLGSITGAGFGAGIAKQGLNLVEQGLGYRKPPEFVSLVSAAQDVGTEAALQGIGMAAGPLVAKGVGKLIDLKNFGSVTGLKATQIAKDALGPDLPYVLDALRSAQGKGVSAAQATADINSPTWQALLQRANARDPRFLQALQESQGEVSLQALARLAGGTTATEARTTAEGLKRGANVFLEPVKESALKRANLGQSVANLETQANALRAAATGKVEDVRRLVKAGEVATEAAQKGFPRTPSGELIGQPRVAARYTYSGDLAKLADRWASEAAEGSLDIGRAARSSQAAADALRANGIKPLETDKLIASLGSITRNPEFAGNDVMSAAVNNLTRDLAKWTNIQGIIPGEALDAIRKNSVNAAVRDLLKGQDPSIQREAAASVMTRIKPLIVNAIEDAGGAGYRQYLTDYAAKMRLIDEKKLTGTALDLWKTNKDAFVRLVQGESPDVVEKALGRGNYDIAKELSDNTMQVLREQAGKHLTNLKVSTQAAAGQDALKQVLLQNLSRVRLPSYLSALTSTTNKALQILEDKIGKGTMQALTESLQTPEGAIGLLERLPAVERNRVLNLISNPTLWTAKAKAIAPAAAVGVAKQTVNALSDQEPINALAP